MDKPANGSTIWRLRCLLAVVVCGLALVPVECGAVAGPHSIFSYPTATANAAAPHPDDHAPAAAAGSDHHAATATDASREAGLQAPEPAKLSIDSAVPVLSAEMPSFTVDDSPVALAPPLPTSPRGTTPGPEPPPP